ncbi:hypothetical protein [Adhaeribacter radiodurans]|uniref:Phage tail tape measure protein n=1 Tax=Adhaeribacter radiodurans TaxID=2745197 RepID=A0A7L7LBC7_9BACT|nr:hypothetical protein [Adhaeribacter radiodurans]QMU30136.1 hypothetical protein HUW48_19820 [Adhaeribacter radiodurans]
MGKVTTDWILDTGKSQANLSELARSLDAYNTTLQKSGDLGRDLFRDSVKSTRDFNQELAQGTRIFQKIETSAQAFETELKGVNKALVDAGKAQKGLTAEAKYDKIQQEAAKVRKQMQDLGDTTEQTGKQASGLGSIFKGALAGAAAYFSIDAIKGFLGGIVDTTAEFQKFDAVLTNTLGSSSVAQTALNTIKDVAATTPFSVAELTESFVKLANQGVVLAKDEIISLGDLASSTGKSFDQLAEAALDAMNGENERLKEFGIKAQKNGETTIFTFKGVRTEVENNAEAINKYLISLGKVDGVAGSMEAISGTIGGQLSNLGDTIDELFLTIGNATSDFISGAISAFASFVKGATAAVLVLKEIPKFVKDNQVAFYALGVAILALNAANIKAAATTLYHAAVERGRAIATQATAVATRVLNAALTANPIGLVIAAISLLVSGLVLWYNKSEQVRAVTQGLFSALKALGSIAIDVFKAIALPTPANIAQAADSLRNFGSKVSGAYNEGYNRQAAKDKAANDAAKNKEIADKLKKEKEQAEFEAAQAAKAKAAAQAKADELRKKKADEAAKKEAAERKKAADELKRELENLEKETNRARLDMLDKNSKEYQLELYAQRTKEIDIMEDTLKRLDKKAGGDGKLDTKQIEQINLLREQALREFQENEYNVELDHRKKLLDLQKDSDAKELAQIELKYQAEIDLAHIAHNRQLAEALEAAKQRELAQAKFRQASNKLDKEESLATETAIAYKVDNTQTDSIKLERDKQQAILDVQIEYAQKRMNLLETETGEETALRRLALANTIEDLKKSKADIQKEQKQADFNIMALLGIDEEDRAAVEESLGIIAGSIQDFTAKQLEAANETLEKRREEVEEKQAALNTEIELNKQGFASNVETRRKELEDAKAARAQALKEQEKAQKRQAQIDSLSQLSSLATASANIIQGWSSLPFVGQVIGLAAVAAMFASFIALKAKAGSIAKAEKGWDYVGGKRHAQGGNKYVSMDSHNDILEIEEGERIVNRKSNQKYWHLLNAINEDDQKELANLSLQYLLQGTNVVPAPETPKEVNRQWQSYQQSKETSSQDLLLEVRHLRKEVSDFKKQAATVNKTDYLPDGTKITTKGNVTRTTHKA